MALLLRLSSSLPRIHYTKLLFILPILFRCLVPFLELFRCLVPLLETRSTHLDRTTAPASLWHRRGVVGTVMTETLTAGTAMMFPFRSCEDMMTTMTILSRRNITPNLFPEFLFSNCQNSPICQRILHHASYSTSLVLFLHNFARWSCIFHLEWACLIQQLYINFKLINFLVNYR